jgi:ribosome silencing factor RsfS/YbeB/iojap
VPLEKKPSRSKPHKKVEDGAASAAVSKSKHTAGAKLPSKPRGVPARGVPARGVQTRGVQTPAAARAALRSVILGALDDMKALEVKVLDVRGLTDIADYMVIASGTSDRHVRSVAQRVVEKTKEAGYRPHGCEGLKDADWVLIDLHEMIVHIMLPRVREFYGLEKLWDMSAKRVARA